MSLRCLLRSPGRVPAALLVAGSSLLAALLLLPGCKSHPRGGVYIKKERPKAADPKLLRDQALAESVLQPHIRDLRYQKFVRPLLTRSGCDSGACHGQFLGGGLYFNEVSGRNKKDYESLLLRLDRKHPEQSELIKKILNQVPHNGGRNIDPNSCDYARLIAWIGEQPEPGCSEPPPTEDAVRFAREVAPALLALGCADKACHGGGPARARFDLQELAAAPGTAAEPAQVAKAQQEVARLNLGNYAGWKMPIMRAADAVDGIHQQKADPLSCAYGRLYGYLVKAPERTCELHPKTPVPPPSLEVFTRQVLPVLGRRGCLQTGCHGSGAGGMTLIPGGVGEPEALHSYLMLIGRIEDLSHVEDSTLLRTARNQEPHGGGLRLGGKGDCLDEQIVAWLHSRPIQPCPPPEPPSFESFVAMVQPVLEKMTCTNPQCHGGLVPHFILANKATLPAQLMMNYKAVLKQIDYDYPPFSGVMMRMREPCAYAVTGAWIEKKPRPSCVVHDPDPNIFPRRDAEGNVLHPKFAPGPPLPSKL